MTDTAPPPANGTKGALVALAGSGSQLVQLVIAIGMVANVLLTNRNGSGINENNRELDKMRQEIFSEVKVIYKNQKIYAAYMEEARADRDAILDKLGVAHERRQPLQQVLIPELEDE